jgi:hypothetical protein
VKTGQPPWEEDGEVPLSLEKMEATRPFMPMDNDGKDQGAQWLRTAAAWLRRTLGLCFKGNREFNFFRLKRF